MLWRGLRYWLVIEVGFYVYFRMRLRNIQPFTNPPPLLPADQIGGAMDLMHKVSETFSVHTASDGAAVRDFFSGWFYGAPFERIRRDNVVEYLAWALWSRFPHGLTERERAQLEGIIQLLEAKYVFTFPQGKDLGLRAMCVPLR